MEKETIEKFFIERTAGSEMFLVDVILKPGNIIQVFLDKPLGITLDECVHLSREFNEAFDREVEDYELQVSSPGLDMPLKVDQQLKKYLEKEVQVVLHDGKKIKAVLVDFSEYELILKVTEKKMEEGKKTKKFVAVDRVINREEIKAIMAVISFK